MIQEEFEIGTIKTAKELNKRGSYKFIWSACPDCGKERWVRLDNYNQQSHKCYKCGYKIMGLKIRGDAHYCWHGGIENRIDGYNQTIVYPNDKYFPMANEKGIILEHRLIMARHLGRCLETNEIVHHKNGIRNDNRKENLILVNGITKHMEYHKDSISRNKQGKFQSKKELIHGK